MALWVTRRKIGTGQKHDDSWSRSTNFLSYSRIEVSQLESFQRNMTRKTVSDISLILMFFYIDVEIVIFSE